ncbi:MAG: pepsin/retropepsin-like aspartic protease family protein [Terracidiphilus sp.]|jgi:predicted aspartyl protease
MRIPAALLIVAVTLPAGLNGQPETPPLKALYDAHRWFELRDVLIRTSAPLFYQAAVEAAFNQQPKAENDLNAIISSKADAGITHEAREILIASFYRAGRYKEAFDQAKAILSKKPDAEDIRNILSTLKVLSSFQDQTVDSVDSSPAPATIPVEIQDQNLVLPLTVNGIQAHYIFDNGFSLSAISESEAKRLGLKIHNVKTSIDTMTGAQVNVRIAVAKDIELAGVPLRNVAFYVLPRNEPPLNHLAEGRQGILGLPVILALRHFQWNPSDRTFTVLRASAEPRGDASKQTPNLAFESTSIFTAVGFQGKDFEFSLDTGAQKTELYPGYSRHFPAIQASGTPESRKLTGVGGSARIDSIRVPSLAFTVGGREVQLKPAHILLRDNNANSNWFAGNLGMDLLNQAHSVEVDFDAMTLLLR